MKTKKLAVRMRKKLAVLTIASVMFVFGFAGNASAYFEDLNLIRSVYTTTGSVEIGTDLGINASTLNSGSSNIYGSTINLSDFDGSLDSLVVGYMTHDQANKDFYATGYLTTAYGGTDTDGLVMQLRKQSNADSNFNSVQFKYAASGLANTTINPKTELNSYFQAFDQAGDAVGSMANNLAATSFEMTLSLADLLTVGYVDQLLYYFDYDGPTGVNGVETVIIRTFLTSDGNTVDLNGTMIASVINPSSVPIPGSILLMGSGLLGLFGIRRRKA